MGSGNEEIRMHLESRGVQNKFENFCYLKCLNKTLDDDDDDNILWECVSQEFFSKRIKDLLESGILGSFHI